MLYGVLCYIQSYIVYMMFFFISSFLFSVFFLFTILYTVVKVRSGLGHARGPAGVHDGHDVVLDRNVS